MVPTFLIPIASFPVTPTGKIDRRQLRRMGGRLTVARLLQMQPRQEMAAPYEPVTEREKKLQDLWASSLGLPGQSIQRHDSFFRLGGDSVAAMRLVNDARGEDIFLSVEDVFSAPRLGDMALLSRTSVVGKSFSDDSIIPFSLLPPGMSEGFVREEVAAQCGIAASQVEDVFPCTPLQEGLISMTARRPETYVRRLVWELNDDADILRFRRAWEELVQRTPILRTRIIDLPGASLVQAVTTESASWTVGRNIHEYLAGDKRGQMGLGTPLTRFATIEEEDASCRKRFFVWTVHHALYDEWSMKLLIDQFKSIYNNKGQPKALPPFQAFIQYIQESRHRSARYWQEHLSGTEENIFPRLPSTQYQPEADSTLQHQILGIGWNNRDTTASTSVRAAWAILLRRYTQAPEVTYGATVTGRQAAVPGVAQMASPTIATVPIRTKLDEECTVDAFLQQVQTQAVNMIPFEQSGLQRISRISNDARRGCVFQSLLVVQPAEMDDTAYCDPVMGRRVKYEDLEDLGIFNSYAMTLECRLQKQGLQVEVSFDSRVIQPEQVKRIAQQYECILRQIVGPEQQSRTLKEISTVSPEDHELLQRWNGVMPERVERCVHELIAERCRAQPDAPAVCAWDGDFTYSELDQVSSALSAHLAELGVGPEVFVPVCFDKSRWTAVAMLGVMKAGGAFALLDTSHPEARQQGICRALSANVVISSASQAPIAQQWVARVVTLGPHDAAWRKECCSRTQAPVAPDNAVYAVFTSGSTGTPKGAVITHSAYCTSAISHSRAFGFSADSRVLQFSSYAFDASILEHLTTLLVGGCVCIPSDADRKNQLGLAARQLRVTWAELTPSTARLLQPAETGALQTLALIGEPVTAGDINRWAGHVDLRNGYGPAECSAVSTVQPGLEKPSDEGNIGRGTGGVCWVADPGDHERLVPIGAVGELLIEGPIVGRGYLNEPEKTAAAFISPPAWLREFRAANPGNPGGDRVYKTGDLVQQASDGSLRFIGRKDTQVKLRGQRIELGEVEHHTRQCFPGARDVMAEVVTPTDDDDGRAPVLVAFVWAEQAGAEEEMQTHEHELLIPPTDMFRAAVPATEARLQNVMPAYTMPAVFLPVVAMPLTATGKTDRRRLRERAAALSRAEMELYRVPAGAKRGPASGAERTLQQLWARVLNLPAEQIGMDDNFFRLGGDSITAMQLSSVARAEGFALTVSDIFHSKTVTALAPLLGMDRQVLLDVEELVDIPFELSPIQSLFFELMPNGASHFNQSFLVPLATSVASCDLARAIPVIVDSHSMLRSRFTQRPDGSWRQAVCADVESSYRYHHSIVASLGEAKSLMSTSQRSLDVQNGPVFSVDLIDIRPGKQQYVFLAAHHLVIDLVSWRIILGDLEGLLRDGQITAGPKSLPFQAWCHLQAEYARDNLGPGEALPFFSLPRAVPDYWGPVDASNTWDNTVHSSFTVGEQLTTLLFAGANDTLQTQPVEIFLAALWHAFVRTFPDRSPPGLFSEGHGREPWDPAIDLSRTVGWFTTIWPLCIETDGGNDSYNIADIVRRAKDARRRIPRNGWAYFASRFLNPDGQQAFEMPRPVEILFNYLGLYQQFEREDAIIQPRITLEDHVSDVAGDVRRFALVDVTAAVDRGCLCFSFSYNRYMQHQDRIRRWITNCEQSLKDAAEDLTGMGRKYTLCDFPLLSLTSYEALDALVDYVNSQILKEQQNSHPSAQTLDHITDAQRVDLLTSPSSLGDSCSNIVDIFPATESQVWFLSQWGSSLLSFSIDGQIDPVRLQHAIQSLVEKYATLRTIFCEYQGSILQVVLERGHAHFTHIHTAMPLDAALKGLSIQDTAQPLLFASPRLKVALISRSDVEHMLVIEMHHALFDRYSLGPVLQDLSSAYNGESFSSSPGASFSDYVRYCHQAQSEAGNQFWREYLRGSEMTRLPCSLGDVSHNLIPIRKSTSMDLPALPLDITFPILVNAAVAHVLGALAHTDDVLFGVVVNTRDIPLQGIKTVLGPCLGFLPLRISLPQCRLVTDICTYAQDQYAHMLQYADMEIPELAGPSTRRPSSTRFNYIVNNIPDYHNSELPPLDGAKWSETLDTHRINLPNQVLIRSLTHRRRLTIQVLTSADSHSAAVFSDFAESLAGNVLSTIQQFCRNPQSDLSSIVLEL